MDSLNLHWFQRLAPVPDRKACLAALRILWLHDCSCVRAAKACHPYRLYNNIHTQTAPIIHEYHCSKSWAVKSDWSVGNCEWQCLLDPLLAVRPHVIRWGRVSGQTSAMRESWQVCICRVTQKQDGGLTSINELVQFYHWGTNASVIKSTEVLMPWW